MTKSSIPISKSNIFNTLQTLNIFPGDTILIRASLREIGVVEGGIQSFIDALLEYLGENGTMIALSFTDSYFIHPPKDKAFTRTSKSYAGALPNRMIKHPKSFRSTHPTCSYIAIGKHAQSITEKHTPSSGAYDVMKDIIDLGGKSIIIGCVSNSPGFTTTHYAEAQLGLLNRSVFPTFNRVYYKNNEDELILFKRSDPGMCSNSFYKFYAHYVQHQILYTSFFGNAYAISANAKESYEIEYRLLTQNSQFNVCGCKDCFRCNAGRWDRIYLVPRYLIRFILRKFFKLTKHSIYK